MHAPTDDAAEIAAVPQQGDLVVTRESKAAIRYTVRQVPGVAQFTASVRDEALRYVRAFAKKQAVDIWYSEKGACRLLETYRARPAPSRAHREHEARLKHSPTE